MPSWPSVRTTRSTFQRLKGLGEMDWEELRATTMVDGTRTLLQVTVEEAADADVITSILMGDDVRQPTRLHHHQRPRRPQPRLLIRATTRLTTHD